MTGESSQTLTYHREPNAQEAECDKTEVFSAKEFTDTRLLILVAWWLEIFIEIVWKLFSIKSSCRAKDFLYFANSTLAEQPSRGLRNDKPVELKIKISSFDLSSYILVIILYNESDGSCSVSIAEICRTSVFTILP